MEFLDRSFAEHSIAWLMISAVLGGFVGSATRSFFEEVVNPRIRERRHLQNIVRELTMPLLRSAESLRGRILNLLSSVRYEDQQIRDDDQYRLSTLYLFAQFLGCVSILEREVFFLDFENSRRSREFNIRLNSVLKGFTSLYYFQETGRRPPSVPTLRRTVLSAIGELIVDPADERRRRILGFAEFVRRAESDPSFGTWLEHLETFLSDLRPEPEDTRWDRLVILSAQLDLLIWFLDPKRNRTRKRQIDVHHMVHPVAIAQFRHELERSGFPEDQVRWPALEVAGGREHDDGKDPVS